MNPASLSPSPALLTDLRVLIDQARQAAAVAVNAGLTLLYWRIGQRIHTEVLAQTRADYGQQILPTLSAQLVPHYGRGFSARSLWRMVQFAQTFPDESQLRQLAGQLGWSHFQELIGVKDPLAREFYAQMCSVERWSVRTLRERVGSLLFERTAVSRQPERCCPRVQPLSKKSKAPCKRPAPAWVRVGTECATPPSPADALLWLPVADWAWPTPSPH